MSGPPDPSSRPVPALRASNADRERTVDLLRQAAGDGRLEVEELDERVTTAYASRTLADLQALTGDLIPGTETAPASPRGAVVAPGSGGTRLILSVMGGHARRGRWRVAANCAVVGIMGGADLDLCDAELSEPTTTIRVLSIMGSSTLRFPSGVDVRVSKLAVMGGHDVKLDAEPPPVGAPVIRVQMLAIMGGNQIRQGRKAHKQRRRLREREELR